MNDQSINIHRNATQRLPPEVNRILFVKNLPFKIKNDELYEIFGKYGAIRQIRKGIRKDTQGTAYIIYEDIYEAKAALEALSGFNVMGRYLVVLYYQKDKMQKKMELKKEQEFIKSFRQKVIKKQEMDLKKKRINK